MTSPELPFNFASRYYLRDVEYTMGCLDAELSNMKEILEEGGLYLSERLCSVEFPDKEGGDYEIYTFASHKPHFKVKCYFRQDGNLSVLEYGERKYKPMSVEQLNKRLADLFQTNYHQELGLYRKGFE
jgi:hypothetical protein